MRAPATAARRIILGSAAAGAIIRGVAYMPWTRSDAGSAYLSPVEAWWPLWVWGWVWITVGVVIACALLWRNLSITAMSALTGLLVLWGSSYVYAWLFQDAHRSWVTGGLFLVMAAWAGVLASLLERRR